MLGQHAAGKIGPPQQMSLCCGEIGRLDDNGWVEWDTVAAPGPGVWSLASNTTNSVCLGPGNVEIVDPDHHVPSFPGRGCDRSEGQPGATLTGPVCGPAYVCRSCICNAHNAMCNRHAKKRPPVTGDFMEARKWFDEFDLDLAYHYILQHSHWSQFWLFKWTKAKQQAILSSLERDAFLPDRVKLMVKREVLGGFKNKARGIQMYMTMATQERFAPNCTAAQKAFAAVFGTEGRRVRGLRVIFASGLNSRHFGAWMSANLVEGRRWFYERDGKSWDATMGKIHQLVKEHVLRKMDSELADFTRDCYDVQGSYVGKDGRRFNYTVKGTTKSGHNDTSLGNSIINAAIAIEAMLEVHPGVEADIIVMGDDLLIAAAEKLDDKRLAEAEARLGIDPDARSFDNWRDVSFISGIWAPYEGGMSFIAKPGSLLHKLFWTTKPPSHKHAQAYRNGIAKGLLRAYEGWPILDAFLRSQIKGDKSYVTREHMYEIAEAEDSRYDGTTEAWLIDRYGIARAGLMEASALFARLSPGPCYVSHPVLDRILEIDGAELQDRVCASAVI